VARTNHHHIELFRKAHLSILKASAPISKILAPFIGHSASFPIKNNQATFPPTRIQFAKMGDILMRIFVAGASGQPLIAELIRLGHSVTGMTQSEFGAKKLAAQGASATIASQLQTPPPSVV
jgi:hypothetical protein